MKNPTQGQSALCARVERTLALNRKAGLNFPGVFMEVTGRELRHDGLRLEFYDDRLFHDGRGEISWVALGVLADLVLGGVARQQGGTTRRPATVHLALQMSGAPVVGDLVAEARFVGYTARTRTTQALSTGTIRAGETLIAHGSGAFVLLDLAPGAEQVTRLWVPEALAREPLEAVAFDAHEAEAIAVCQRAEAAASRKHPFIEHFWCGIPKKRDGGADLDVEVTAHLGNRVRHAHGGVLLGTAAYVAAAAAHSKARLSNISAYFVSPGLPPRLKVRSRVVQQGRNLAVVRTQIVRPDGKLVLEATTQHAAA
jgi:acyl-coenzyme A thioesterase PaaI-like protein